MKKSAKTLVLSSLIMLLSACASSNYGGYGGYSGNDDFYSGYNYPNNGYYPPGNPYGNRYQRYPVNPGYRGYNGPYYGGNPNNNYYYNRQPRPVPAPPGFYRRNPPAQIHHHHHHENNYYGRSPYNQGGRQGGNRQAPSAPPAVGRWQQQPEPQRNWGGQRNWPRQQNQQFNRSGGGQWRTQNRPQQPVVRIQNNGGNVNFGRMTDRMRQQAMQPGRNRAFWQRKRRGQDD